MFFSISHSLRYFSARYYTIRLWRMTITWHYEPLMPPFYSGPRKVYNFSIDFGSQFHLFLGMKKQPFNSRAEFDENAKEKEWSWPKKKA